MFLDGGPVQNSCLRSQVWSLGKNLPTLLGSQAKVVSSPPRRW